MATTRFVLKPGAAEPASGNPRKAELDGRRVLVFDAFDPSDTCYWIEVAPQGLTGALIAKIKARCANATLGSAGWRIFVEAVPTDGDLGTITFDAANEAVVTVPTTTTHLFEVSIPLTYDASIAPGQYVRFALARKITGNTVACGLAFLAMEIQEA